MKEPFYRIFSIDKEHNRATLQHFESEDSISAYIDQIVEENNNHHDRNYGFTPNDTFFPKVIETLLPKEDNIDNICQLIADRLLEKEIEANNKIKQTNKSIPASFLIIALNVNKSCECQMLFIKADKTSFINTVSGRMDVGLPAKKKIFKSCVFDIIIKDEKIKINHIVSHDANSQGKSVYWFHNFLCLDEERSDEANTKEAFKIVKKKILDPIKKEHKQDYLNIRNAVIHYFRSDGDFDVEDFRDNVIGGYHPFDGNLDVEDLKKKIDKISELGTIDNRFQKKPEVIKDKFKETVKLSDDIELHLLQDIQDVDKVIQSGNDNGRKYIKIYSDTGYEYAKGLTRR
ncbi:hypothetical protein LPYR103PRE_02360 [Segatella asaccharophila]|jgi:hypothetical protein